MSDVEVGKTHTVEYVQCLEVERGVVGVASEGYCSALLKEEVLLYDVLYGELVDTVVDNLVAVYVECSLVKICGSKHTVSI